MLQCRYNALQDFSRGNINFRNLLHAFYHEKDFLQVFLNKYNTMIFEEAPLNSKAIKTNLSDINNYFKEDTKFLLDFYDNIIRTIIPTTMEKSLDKVKSQINTIFDVFNNDETSRVLGAKFMKHTLQEDSWFTKFPPKVEFSSRQSTYKENANELMDYITSILTEKPELEKLVSQIPEIANKTYSR